MTKTYGPYTCDLLLHSTFDFSINIYYTLESNIVPIITVLDWSSGAIFEFDSDSELFIEIKWNFYNSALLGTKSYCGELRRISGHEYLVRLIKSKMVELV